MTASSGAFLLHGTDDDETRLLEHVDLGYSIAIPGRPRVEGTSSTYDVIIRLADVPIELGFRMEEVPIETNVVERLPALMEAHVQSWARNAGEARPEWSRDRLLPAGAARAMHCTYALAGEESDAIELLAIVLKQGRHELHALYLTARYRSEEMLPAGWESVRDALLHRQSWDPARLAV